MANHRRPLSPETRAKIGAANRGRKFSPEICAAMSAARKGKPRGPYSAEHCAAISAAKKGKPQTEAHRLANSLAHKGQVVSPERRAAIGAFFRGTRRVFTPEWCARIGAAQRGRSQTAESNARRAEAMKRAWEEGRKEPNREFRYTGLAKSLHRCLESRMGITLEPEIRFGRFTVDLYDRVNHVGYEADGRYWHRRNEAARPGYHAERDAYLLGRFGLRVVHYDEVQIQAMEREVA